MYVNSPANYNDVSNIVTLHTNSYVHTGTVDLDLETTVTMKKLNHYITDMASHYYDIGLELDIPNSKLKAIKNNFTVPDIKEKCREMCQIWLDNDTHATWKRLCDALKEVKQSVLAENIRKAIIST